MSTTPQRKPSLRAGPSSIFAVLFLLFLSTVQSFPQQSTFSAQRIQAQPKCMLHARPPPPNRAPWDEEDDFYGPPQGYSEPRRPPPSQRDGMPMDFPGQRRREEDSLYYEEDQRFDEEEPYYEDEEEFPEEGGNFWSNPPARYDPVQSPEPRGRVPRPNEPPRVRRRPQQSSRGDVRGQRRRKATFRSGTPPPPKPVGDFYNHLFWYGFDPAEASDSPADKTMFGGTKGKFNGLAFLNGEPAPEQQRPQRPPPRRRDPYEEEDGYYEDRPPPPLDEEPQFRQQQRRPRGQTNVFDGGDVKNEANRNRRPSRPREGGGDWASKKVASWFEDDDYVGMRDVAQGRRRRGTSQSSSPWPPNVDVFSTFFGVDRERQRRAAMYDQKMGIGVNGEVKNGKSVRRPTRPPPGQERRNGYAYRYDAEQEDDDTIVDADVIISDVDGVEDANETTDDKPAKIPENETNSNGVENPTQQENRAPPQQKPGRERSWEERQLARERIPPPDVHAWGPSGDLGMDARMKAYTDALQDVRAAEINVEKRKKHEQECMDKITVLSVDSKMSVRRRIESQHESKRLTDECRRLEIELDRAQRSKRKASAQVRFAQSRLSELKDWYGPLLALYNPSQAKDVVDEALREFQETEPAARMPNRPNDDNSSTAAKSPN